jgi:hypothetical protein
MKQAFIAAVAASVFLFAACSNSDSLSAEPESLSEEPLIEPEEEPLDEPEQGPTRVLDTMGTATVFEFPGALTVNEKEHKITITPNTKTMEACVAEGNSYTWKTISVADAPYSYWYEFRGDSLLLYYIDPDEDDGSWEKRAYGAILVGGKDGNLEGTWEFTGCEYTTENRKIKCYDPLDEQTAVSFKFTGKKAVKIERRFHEKYLEELEAVGYVDVLISGLYESLASIYCYGFSLGSPFEFYSKNVAQSNRQDASRYKVDVIGSTENSRTFTVGGKTYTFKVNKVEQSLDEYNDLLKDISAEVTDGTTTCVGYYKIQKIEKRQCNAKNAEMFFEETGYADNNREIHYSYRYLDQNEDELTKCVDKIAAKSYDPELENLKESEK